MKAYKISRTMAGGYALCVCVVTLVLALGQLASAYEMKDPIDWSSTDLHDLLQQTEALEDAHAQLLAFYESQINTHNQHSPHQLFQNQGGSLLDEKSNPLFYSAFSDRFPGISLSPLASSINSFFAKSTADMYGLAETFVRNSEAEEGGFYKFYKTLEEAAKSADLYHYKDASKNWKNTAEKEQEEEEKESSSTTDSSVDVSENEENQESEDSGSNTNDKPPSLVLKRAKEDFKTKEIPLFLGADSGVKAKPPSGFFPSNFKGFFDNLVANRSGASKELFSLGLRRLWQEEEEVGGLTFSIEDVNAKSSSKKEEFREQKGEEEGVAQEEAVLDDANVSALVLSPDLKIDGVDESVFSLLSGLAEGHQKVEDEIKLHQKLKDEEKLPHAVGDAAVPHRQLQAMHTHLQSESSSPQEDVETPSFEPHPYLSVNPLQLMAREALLSMLVGCACVSPIRNNHCDVTTLSFRPFLGCRNQFDDDDELSFAEKRELVRFSASYSTLLNVMMEVEEDAMKLIQLVRQGSTGKLVELGAEANTQKLLELGSGAKAQKLVEFEEVNTRKPLILKAETCTPKNHPESTTKDEVATSKFLQAAADEVLVLPVWMSPYFRSLDFAFSQAHKTAVAFSSMSSYDVCVRLNQYAEESCFYEDPLSRYRLCECEFLHGSGYLCAIPSFIRGDCADFEEKSVGGWRDVESVESVGGSGDLAGEGGVGAFQDSQHVEGMHLGGGFSKRRGATRYAVEKEYKQTQQPLLRLWLMNYDRTSGDDYFVLPEMGRTVRVESNEENRCNEEGKRRSEHADGVFRSKFALDSKEIPSFVQKTREFAEKSDVSSSSVDKGNINFRELQSHTKHLRRALSLVDEEGVEEEVAAKEVIHEALPEREELEVTEKRYLSGGYASQGCTVSSRSSYSSTQTSPSMKMETDCWDSCFYSSLCDYASLDEKGSCFHYQSKEMPAYTQHDAVFYKKCPYSIDGDTLEGQSNPPPSPPPLYPPSTLQGFSRYAPPPHLRGMPLPPNYPSATDRYLQELSGLVLPPGYAMPPYNPVSVGSEGGNVIDTMKSFILAGNTLFNTIPLDEALTMMALFGKSGFFHSRGINLLGGVRNRGSKLDQLPSLSYGIPTAKCTDQGMSCCVPEAAVSAGRKAKYRPYFKGAEKDPLCQTHHSSPDNAYCATTTYDNSPCGLSKFETSVQVSYQVTLIVPNSASNNVICDCRRIKNPEVGSARIEASAVWEFSLASFNERAKELESNSTLADRFIAALDVATNFLNNSSEFIESGGFGY